jgi:hypothetical protein
VIYTSGVRVSTFIGTIVIPTRGNSMVPLLGQYLVAFTFSPSLRDVSIKILLISLVNTMYQNALISSEIGA